MKSGLFFENFETIFFFVFEAFFGSSGFPPSSLNEDLVWSLRRYMLEKNVHGRRYFRGKGDPAIWAEISDEKAKNTHKGIAEIAGACRVSTSTVHKVQGRNEIGEFAPRPPSYHRHFHELSEVTHLPIIEELLSQSGGVTTIASLTRQFGEKAGVQFSKSALADFLRKCGISRKHGNIIDPRKFSADNLKYYETYVIWRSQLTSQERMNLMFFDEVRVEKSDLGGDYVYSPRGQRTHVPGYHGRCGG